MTILTCTSSVFAIQKRFGVSMRVDNVGVAPRPGYCISLRFCEYGVHCMYIYLNSENFLRE